MKTTPVMDSFHRHSLKMLLAVKLLVILFVVADLNGWIRFGEQESTAADAKVSDAKGEAKDTGPALAQNNKAGAAEESEEQDFVARKSYLDDLLNLPKLNPDNLKKEEIGRYMHIVEKKTAQVEKRIDILRRREKQLKTLESSIDRKLQKLEEEIDFFKQTINKEKKINAERLDNLVEFYKKMKPKKAAPVFENMDKDLVVALFNRIPKKQTRTILSLMDPKKSVELSEYYGRIRSGNEYEILKQVNSALRKEFAECKGLPKDALTEAP